MVTKFTQSIMSLALFTLCVATQASFANDAIHLTRGVYQGKDLGGNACSIQVVDVLQSGSVVTHISFARGAFQLSQPVEDMGSFIGARVQNGPAEMVDVKLNVQDIPEDFVYQTRGIRKVCANLQRF